MVLRVWSLIRYKGGGGIRIGIQHTYSVCSWGWGVGGWEWEGWCVCLCLCLWVWWGRGKEEIARIDGVEVVVGGG